MNPRVEPLSPPYEPETEKLLSSMMPPGVPLLNLFKTLAHNHRVSEKMRNGGLLDRGVITLREREILIDRVTALCKAEYEWGVHIAFFAEKIKLSKEQITSLTFGSPNDSVWSESESALIHLTDELNAGAQISDSTWEKLSNHFSAEQVIEAIAIIGYYHTVSFMVNGLKVENETFGAKFEDYNA
jgi:alkylhydroperoxidase family enzyme